MTFEKEKDNPSEVKRYVMSGQQDQACVGSPGEKEVTCWCQKRDMYLTKEEEEALSSLRGIRSQAISLKNRIKDLRQVIDFELLNKQKDLLSPEEQLRSVEQEKLNAELTNCEKQLEKVQSQWKAWDEKRAQATRVKMVLLGHTT